MKRLTIEQKAARFTGWQRNGVPVTDEAEIEGYNETYYWDDKGYYLGADEFGIEPIYQGGTLTQEQITEQAQILALQHQGDGIEPCDAGTLWTLERRLGRQLAYDDQEIALDAYYAARRIARRKLDRPAAGLAELRWSK